MGVCLYVLRGHLLGKGWPLGSRLWCLLWVCHFPIDILGQVWYLIVSIPDLCKLSYFYNFVCTDSTEIFFSKLRPAGLNYNLSSFFTGLLCGGYLISNAYWLFSSPEPKAPRWAISIPVTPASVVRPSVSPSVRQHFQTSSPLKPLGQLNSNFIWRLLRNGEPKFVQMFVVTWPRWPPCPYMVKTL